MALASDDEVSANKIDEVNMPSSDTEEVEHIDDEEEKQPLTPEEKLPSLENLDEKRRERLKNRSVSFAPTVEEFEIPCNSSYQPTDYIDALVESYKLQTSYNLFPVHEEKKYISKTTRSRINPNWREHRIRRLMNKLEELSLWDREEELKATQAQFLREQKLEQIQDRQRNHELCLNLMRQRHESEMESAVLLDRGANHFNDENIHSIIAQTMNLVSPANILTYDLPNPPVSLKRRVRQEQEKVPLFKTPTGRYRQFETNMNNKLDKINQKLQPDREIMRAYSPYHGSIPPTVVPLFSETYASLLSIPDTYSTNRYNHHHYGGTSYLHQSPPHASSPDYETRVRSHSNRDVRVPLKEQANEINNHNDDDNDSDYHHSRFSSSPSRRSTNLVSTTASSLYDCSTVVNTPREYSFIHSPQPMSNKIQYRSLNDDLNAITQFSHETSKKILQNSSESSKNRSSSVPTNKRITFIDEEDENEENFNYNQSSKMMPQPKMISLSST